MREPAMPRVDRVMLLLAAVEAGSFGGARHALSVGDRPNPCAMIGGALL
jgi:hypothetical protein